MATDLVQTSAGSRLFVSAGLPASFTPAGFAALTYTEIGFVDDIGELGASIAPVTFTPVGDAIEDSFHGVLSLGDTTVSAALVGGDAGQTIVTDGFEQRKTLSFKLQLSDGDVVYFIAIVLSSPINVGGPSNIVMTSFNLRRKPMGAIDRVYVEAAM